MPDEYLELEDVLDAYAEVFGCTAQQAADQLRDRAWLEAALARPAQWAFYEGADLATQAAVLVHGIAERQPFIEGNKRTALVSLIAFLRLNGHDLAASEDERFQWMHDLAAGMAVDTLAARIRTRLVPWSA